MHHYTKQEIVALAREFNGYLEREMRLKEELLSLKLNGPRDLVQQNLKRHDEIFAELDDIRMNMMLPILKEVAAFVRYCESLRGGVKLAPEKLKESRMELESSVEQSPDSP
jgi:hypothetical protein